MAKRVEWDRALWPGGKARSIHRGDPRLPATAAASSTTSAFPGASSSARRIEASAPVQSQSCPCRMWRERDVRLGEIGLQRQRTFCSFAGALGNPPRTVSSRPFPPRSSGHAPVQPTPMHTPGQGSMLGANARCPSLRLLVSGGIPGIVPAGKADTPPHSSHAPSPPRALPPSPRHSPTDLACPPAVTIAALPRLTARCHPALRRCPPVRGRRSPTTDASRWPPGRVER